MTSAQPPKFLAVVEEVEYSHTNCRKKQWKRAGLLKSYCMSCGQINDCGGNCGCCGSGGNGSSGSSAVVPLERVRDWLFVDR